MRTEIIQLCEANLFCVRTAAVYIRIHKGGQASRPIGCCAECRPGVEKKITDEGCTFTVETIPQKTA